MQILSLVSLIIYTVFMLLYFKKLLQPKRTHWLFYVSAVALHTGIAIPAYILLDHRFVPYFMIGAMMLAVNLLFYGNWIQRLYVGGIYMFSLYCSRGVVIAIYSIALNSGFQDVLRNETHYNTIFALSVLISILTTLFIRKVILPDERARHLLNNRGQLRFVVICLLSQFIFLMFINNGRYYEEIRELWYSYLCLISCVISNLWLLFVLDHTAKVSELLEYELHTRQLKEQLSRQLRHYQSYSKFTESYRVFKHDYKNLMTSVKTLIGKHEYEKAVRMIDNIHDTMQKNIQIHKDYSDNILLDAILQEAANACEEKNIHFSAVAHLPKNVPFKELDIVRIFTNIMNNAIEACGKVAVGERFIKITSRGNKNWAYIEISNSFNGELLLKDGIPETTKNNKDFHGLGLRIIKETVEGLGGLLSIESDPEKRIFSIKLCIPKIAE